jgi:MFS family permease
MAGRIADVYGARPTLLAITTIVVLGGSVSALATIFPLFVLGQFLQGFGLGLLPVSFVVLRRTLSSEQLKTATGLLGAVVVAGGALGVVLAGPVAENVSRTAMYAVPTAFVILGAIAFAVSTPRDRMSKVGGRLDWPGAGGLALGLLTLTAWLASASSNGWGAPTSMLLVLASASVFTIWARYQSRTNEPMVDLTMMRHRSMWSAVVVGVVFGFTYGAVVYLLPQQLAAPAASGFGRGASTSAIGILLCIGYGAAVIASVISGKLAQRVGTKAIAVAGVALLGLSGAVGVFATTMWQIVVVLILAGTGVAAASTAVFVISADSAPADRVGVTTAIVTIARSLGSAVGTQIAAGIIASATSSGGLPRHSAFATAFGVAAIVAIVGLVVAVTMPRAGAGATDVQWSSSSSSKSATPRFQ